MTPERLESIAADVVARAAPGEELEAYVASGTRTSVRAHDGAVESLTRATTAGIGVRIVTAGRQGFASAGSLDPDIIADTVAAARDNAGFAEPDRATALAQPDGVAAPAVAIELDDFDEVPMDAKVDLALDLERCTRGRDRRITGVRTARYADADGAVAVASTTGVLASERATSCSLAVQALAVDGDDTQTGAGVDAARTFDRLSVDVAAADAVERAVAMLGARQPGSSRVAIVLEPRVAAALVGVVAGMLSGTNVVKGRSPFADRRGDVVASPLFGLDDDPTDVRSLGADHFDGEGLASRAVPLVTAGRLVGFVHDSWSGRRCGTASTASAVRSTRSTPAAAVRVPRMVAGTGTLDDLVGSLDRGVLVRSMSGLHSGVNPVSGDFSVGVEGHTIAAGERGAPIREATVAATVQRLLGNIVAVGGDLEWQPGGAGACSLVIDDVSLSGA